MRILSCVRSVVDELLKQVNTDITLLMSIQHAGKHGWIDVRVSEPYLVRIASAKRTIVKGAILESRVDEQAIDKVAVAELNAP